MIVHPPRGIHPSAVDPARLGEGVEIGAFCVIGAEVEIGDGTAIGPHVVIHGPTRDRPRQPHPRLRRDRRRPAGQEVPRRAREPGDRRPQHHPRVRHHQPRHRRRRRHHPIGDDNWIMAYVHIAHDCIVGNHTIFANNASLAGHVRIGDRVILGGFSADPPVLPRSARTPSPAWALGQPRRAAVRDGRQAPTPSRAASTPKA
jgi:UDP-N-acetylglucosamine acyltransferase